MTSVWRAWGCPEWRVPLHACCTCGWNGQDRGEDWDAAREDARLHRVAAHGGPT